MLLLKCSTSPNSRFTVLPLHLACCCAYRAIKRHDEWSLFPGPFLATGKSPQLEIAPSLIRHFGEWHIPISEFH